VVELEIVGQLPVISNSKIKWFYRTESLQRSSQFNEDVIECINYLVVLVSTSLKSDTQKFWWQKLCHYGSTLWNVWHRTCDRTSAMDSLADYCNSLLLICSNRNLDKLQRVQNNLARVVCNSSRLTPAEPLLRSLHWLSVRQWIDYKLTNLCYLAIFFHQLVYLAHLIRPYSQSRSLRSSTQSFLSVPPHNIDIAARRFSIAAPRLWNSLPLSCQTAPSVNIFKNRLKTFSLW